MSATGGSETGGNANSAGSQPRGGADQTGVAGAGERCPEVVEPRANASARLDLKTTLYFGDAALSPGQPNTLANGSVLTPLNVRFYMSHLELVRADGSAAPADLVNGQSAVEPYGVHLVNADDESSMSVHVRGPQGSYTGLRFVLGLDDACNAGSAERRAPLSATSGMVWPPPFGYLFLRYEGMFTPAGKETISPPGAIHMGGLVGQLMAPTVTAAGSFMLSEGSPTEGSLQVAIDKLFDAAMAPVELGDFAGPPGNEVQAGERVRQSAATTPIFSVVQP